MIILIGGSALSSPASACGSRVGTPAAASKLDLDADQMSIARQVVAAVRAFPATSAKPHAAVIALATARQESGLRNLDYGDRDSRGVFQQRPSQGWRTPDQVMNVAHATTSFLQHLVLVPEWESRRVTDVAADVQRPAAEYRGLYQQWVPLATELTNELWSGAAVGAGGAPGCGAGGPSSPAGTPASSSVLARAQSWVEAQVPYSQSSYFTNQYGTYRQDCSGYVSMAWGLPTSLTTYSLPGVSHPIAKDELRAGDILLRPGHTLLFDKWANPERSAYWAYEEQHTGTVAVHHVVPYPYWPGYGAFTPRRRTP
ncbi:MAG: hypothetical protein ACSLEW_12035 [Nocardioides sp.]